MSDEFEFEEHQRFLPEDFPHRRMVKFLITVGLIEVTALTTVEVFNGSLDMSTATLILGAGVVGFAIGQGINHLLERIRNRPGQQGPNIE